MGFPAPIIINVFGTSLSFATGPTWQALLTSGLGSGSKTTLAGFDTIVEGVLNQTRSFTSSAAGAFLDPSISGDFWTLATILAGLGGVLSGLITTVLALENAGSGA